MRSVIIPTMLLLVALCADARAQNTGMTMPMGKNPEEKPLTLMAGLGSQHHPVSTKNAEAQKFFDQGLTLVFAFNHEEAIRSFKKAAELDPQLGMAYWGIALALGPNINLDVDPEREKAAYEAVQKAMALAANAPEIERAYIMALARRYSIAPGVDLKKLAVDYKNAMGELSRRYPDDLDAATLYAESMMNLNPWKFWTPDGKPNEGTMEIVAVLESVLRRDPNHIGAIHYYIHAVEASGNPERALAYAPRLPQITPAAGHLVHMPAHIYMRTGDYNAAAISNAEAAAADEAFFKMKGTAGLYPVMYYNHNLHFLAIAYSMSGQYEESLDAAVRLEKNVGPAAKSDAMLEGFVTTTTLVMVKFRRWDDILNITQPDADLHAKMAVWHFARGMAYAAKGKLVDAEIQRKLCAAEAGKIAENALFSLNNARKIVAVAGVVLDARIAVAKKDYATALPLLRKAVDLEDAFVYDEPPPWFLPVRETLGGVLLQTKDYVEAEKVFRAELSRNPRSGRALFGLMESLKGQGKNADAQFVEREFKRAWKDADTELRIEDL